MAASLIYKNAAVYNLVMRALYRQHYHARHQAVADLVPPGTTVLELCCGSAYLYHRYLRRKNVAYTGLDINPGFIENLARLGASGVVWNLRSDKPLPTADYVIMQGSLYEFLPDVSGIVDRMLRAARKQVIISEPVRNLATSRLAVIAGLAQRFTNPGLGPAVHRFTESTFDDLVACYGDRVKRSFLIPGGREKICVVEAGPACMRR